MEGLIKSVADFIVYVHPSQIKNVDKAILRELSSLLFKYSQDFDGAVLAYSVEPQDKRARILSGVHPYFGVRLQAYMLIFSPKANMLLGNKTKKRIGYWKTFTTFLNVFVHEFTSKSFQ